MRLCFSVAKDTGQSLHSVLNLPWSELCLWSAFYSLENDEYEYYKKNKHPRPIGGGKSIGWENVENFLDKESKK